MLKEEVIEAIKMFRPDSIRSPKVEWESKDFINISFYIQGYNMKWYKVNYNISKKAIKELW